jgi:erythromycin esterase-like protein
MHKSALRRIVQPLNGTSGEWDSLMGLIGDARIVMLGESTHGTHEFYSARAAITKRLILDRGFHAVVIEADWPDALRIDGYVRSTTSDNDTADEALATFERFPRWMWRNVEILALVNWMRSHNRSLLVDQPRVGFYGMDLYSLTRSQEEVIAYLDRVDPEAADRARYRYACFDHFGEDPQSYGYAAAFGLEPSCEQEVVQQLAELQRRAVEIAVPAGDPAADEFFAAEQNARLIRNAEQYYRAMFAGRVSSWNVRDQHMADTLDALSRHLQRQGVEAPRMVVWAHNSHIGDARATAVASQGEWNVGQLMRQRHGSAVRLIGFTTYSGSVMAASSWGAQGQTQELRPALEDSYEALFHQLDLPAFLLPVRGHGEAFEALPEQALERAVGVVYLPRTERVSHYFHANLAQQFDAVVHFDQSRALEPLRAAHAEFTEPATEVKLGGLRTVLRAPGNELKEEETFT